MHPPRILQLIFLSHNSQLRNTPTLNLKHRGIGNDLEHVDDDPNSILYCSKPMHEYSNRLWSWSPNQLPPFPKCIWHPVYWAINSQPSKLSLRANHLESTINPSLMYPYCKSPYPILYPLSKKSMILSTKYPVLPHSGFEPSPFGTPKISSTNCFTRYIPLTLRSTT